MRLGFAYDVKREAFEGQRDDEFEEFDSPETIKRLVETLESFGHDVLCLGGGEALVRRLLEGPRPDLVLNISEGTGISRCREARVPALLELLGVPYTGSDPLALGATLDKDVAKRLVSSVGVLTPDWVLVREHDDAASCAAALERLPWPRIVKPAFEGSSKGVRNRCLVTDEAAQRELLAELRRDYAQPLLVEEFIDGEELTVGLLGNPLDVLGIMRIRPVAESGPFVYGLEVKRDWERLVRYEAPAKLEAELDREVRRSALRVADVLGLRDVARADFRVRDGRAYFLEVNPLPGLSPMSGDLVFLARGVGVEHRELLRRIIDCAALRVGLDASAPRANVSGPRGVADARTGAAASLSR